jgi:hypothetical protein
MRSSTMTFCKRPYGFWNLEFLCLDWKLVVWKKNRWTRGVIWCTISMSDLKNMFKIFELQLVESDPGTYVKVRFWLSLVHSLISFSFRVYSVLCCAFWLNCWICTITLVVQAIIWLNVANGILIRQLRLTLPNWGLCSGGFVHSAKWSSRTPQGAHPGWACTS